MRLPPSIPFQIRTPVSEAANHPHIGHDTLMEESVLASGGRETAVEVGLKGEEKFETALSVKGQRHGAAMESVYPGHRNKQVSTHNTDSHCLYGTDRKHG